jgi:WD40 repeat protein
MARVWNNNGNLVLRHPSTVSGVAWRPKHDDQLATVSEDGILRVWTLSSGKSELECEKPDCCEKPVCTESVSDGRRLNCVAFSPDGEFLVTGGASKTLKYWNPETARKTGEVSISEEPVTVDISPDSRSVVLGGIKGGIMALERTSATPARLESGSEKRERKITAVRFLDNDRFASASSDGTIRIWRFRDHQQLMSLRAAEATGFFGIAYQSRDQTLFGAQESTLVRVFRLQRDVLLEYAKDQLGKLKSNIEPRDCALYGVPCP